MKMPSLSLLPFGLLLAALTVSPGCEPPSAPPSMTRPDAQRPAEPDTTDAPDAVTPSEPGEPTPVEPGPAQDSELAKAIKALAVQVLGTWQRRDLNGLAALSPEGAGGVLWQLTPGNPRYESLFGADSWRVAAVAAWGGTIGAIRGEGELARAHFANLPGGRAAVVELARVDGQWRLVNIARPRLDVFVDWGELL